MQEVKTLKLFSVEVKNEMAKLNHEIYSSSSSVTTFRTEILTDEKFLNFQKVHGVSLPGDTTEVLATDLTICEDWKLSIDLKLPNRSTTEWKNIFSLYAHKKTGQLDQRVLAVSLRPDQSNVALMIAYEVDTNQIYTYNITKKLNAGNWINLKISQISGVYKIKLDNELVNSKTNSVSKVWTYVNLLTRKTNGKDSISTIVNYRSFKIKSCKKRGKKNDKYKLSKKMFFFSNAARSSLYSLLVHIDHLF